VIGKPGAYLAALLRELGLVVTVAAPSDDLTKLGTFACWSMAPSALSRPRWRPRSMCRAVS
jgi:hypothetical protein